jgi:2-alkenal reductase
VAGLMIAEITPHSPAAAAGLAAYDRDTDTMGDIITHADGHRVVTIADLALILEQIGIGNHVMLSVLRDGRSRTVDLVVMDTQHAS